MENGLPQINNQNKNIISLRKNGRVTVNLKIKLDSHTDHNQDKKTEREKRNKYIYFN